MFRKLFFPYYSLKSLYDITWVSLTFKTNWIINGNIIPSDCLSWITSLQLGPIAARPWDIFTDSVALVEHRNSPQRNLWRIFTHDAIFPAQVRRDGDFCRWCENGCISINTERPVGSVCAEQVAEDTSGAFFYIVLDVELGVENFEETTQAVTVASVIHVQSILVFGWSPFDSVDADFENEIDQI